MNNMREAALLLFVVSLCLAHASPGRRRQNNNNNNNLPSADPRQGGPAEDDDDGRIGFYHGPPEGFPSFDNFFPASQSSSSSSPSFGGRPSRNPQESSSADFQSSFEGNSPFLREEEERRPSYNSGRGSGEDEEHSYPAVPVLRPSYSSSSFEDNNDEGDEGGRYGPSGPSSSPVSGEEPRGSGEFNRHHENQPFNSYEESFPPQRRPPVEEHYPPQENAPLSQRGQSTHHYSSSKEPIVLKKPRARRSLPSPPSSSPLSPTSSNKTEHVVDLAVDPMLADGSTQSKSTLYWPSSPFISFDHYKTSSSAEDDSTARSDNNNASSSSSLHDSTSEEQRFFPSFPSPYLSPFSSRPHLTSPLNFPGPSANHRPSRYPSSSPLPFSKFPSRGPSSAASHDTRYTDTNILGSGNFEVVRGGTYYGDEGASRPSYGGHHGGGGAYHSSPDSDDDYYSPPGNGHSSPYHGGGGGGSSGGGGDFFANFRDFADINPHSRSFSHHRIQVLGADGEYEEEEETPEASSHSSARTIRRSSTSSSSSSGAKGRRRRPTFSMDYDPMVATF